MQEKVICQLKKILLVVDEISRLLDCLSTQLFYNLNPLKTHLCETWCFFKMFEIGWPFLLEGLVELSSLGTTYDTWHTKFIKWLLMSFVSVAMFTQISFNFVNGGSGLKGQSNRRLISMNEVKQHRQEGSMWTVLKGRVYNLSPYMRFHPGGMDTILFR